jgi:serine/threonine-protein kinase
MVTGDVPFKGESQVAVAMKHVREALPDVQAKRGEVSAALASVIDTATAKRLENRYHDADEMIADLEEVLAIETSRAGAATGEATAVLRTLPSRTRRRISFSLRHRAITPLLALLLVAAGVAVAVWLASRTHHGAGKPEHPPAAAPIAVDLCQNCANAYNPDGLGGDTSQNDNSAGLAIDGNPTTFWQTQQYYSGTLGKPGVGLYVDAHPGVAARVLRILTTSPGFSAQIRARTTTPAASGPDPGNNSDGWTLLATVGSVRHRQDIALSTGGTRYRYYLVWITKLPPGRQSVTLNEVALFR